MVVADFFAISVTDVATTTSGICNGHNHNNKNKNDNERLLLTATVNDYDDWYL